MNVVPSGHPISSNAFSSPPSIKYLLPNTSSRFFVTNSTIATALILESASPRNPRLDTLSKSSTERILLVACRKNAVLISSFRIPQPLSVIRIKLIPPSLISTVMAFAPASIAFSTNSFTTAAGRSTTSPAAILFIVFWSNTVILPILYHSFTLS